jgi:hypothetical protein
MIEDDVRTALLPAFPGLEVIHANQNGPRPDGMYVSVRIETAHEMPAHVGALTAPQPIPAFGSRPLGAHRVGQIELQCFGAQGYDTLETAGLLLAGDVCMGAAEAVGIVFGVVADLQNVPALFNESQWEPRAVCSLPFAYTRNVVEAVPVIETVQGTISIEGLPDMPYEVAIVDN